MYHYKTHGTCSSEIELEIQNGIITHCKFIGGCKGNTPVSYTHLTLPTILLV